MLQVFVNFFTFEALNTPPEVYFALAGVWAILLVAGLASVFGRLMNVWLKIFWAVMIVALPIAGMIFYCLFCLVTADYSFFKMFGLHRQTASYLRNFKPGEKKNA